MNEIPIYKRETWYPNFANVAYVPAMALETVAAAEAERLGLKRISGRGGWRRWASRFVCLCPPEATSCMEAHVVIVASKLED